MGALPQLLAELPEQGEGGLVRPGPGRLDREREPIALGGPLGERPGAAGADRPLERLLCERRDPRRKEVPGRRGTAERRLDPEEVLHRRDGRGPDINRTRGAGHLGGKAALVRPPGPVTLLRPNPSRGRGRSAWPGNLRSSGYSSAESGSRRRGFSGSPRGTPRTARSSPPSWRGVPRTSRPPSTPPRRRIPRGEPCRRRSAASSSSVPPSSSGSARRSWPHRHPRDGQGQRRGRGDVQEAIDMSTYMAGEGRRLHGQTTPSELHAKFC